MLTAQGKGKATTKSKALEKVSEERVQSGFQLLLGNGEVLSKDVFLGFGASTFYATSTILANIRGKTFEKSCHGLGGTVTRAWLTK